MTLGLAFPNRFDGATLSGNGWTVGLPLSNLATRQISQVARTLVNSGSFYAALGSAKTTGAIGVVGHNLTTDGQWRARAFDHDPRPVLHGDLRAGEMPSGFAFSRSGTATYFDAAGVLQTASNNVERWALDGNGNITGLLLEALAVNRLIYSRDGTNADWTKVTMGRAKDATGIDDAANACTTLSASSSNARISAGGTTGTNPSVFSVYLRRVTGTGTIYITADNFATLTPVTLTSAWQRFEVSAAASACTCGIQIVTSGDVIEMDGAQLESGTLASSVIMTAGATATRNAESITRTGLSLTGVGVMTIAGTLLRQPTGSNAEIAVADQGSPKATLSVADTGQVQAIYTNSGTQCSITTGTVADGAAINASFAFEANNFRLAVDGVQGTQDTSGTMSASAFTSLTFRAEDFCGWVLTEFRLDAPSIADADLEELSTTDCEHAASYDSGLIDAWPAAWVSGTTEDQRSGVRGEATLVTIAEQSAQYWRFDLADDTNPAGYIQLGRVFLGPLWRPDFGLLSGVTLGYESRSTTTEADDGAEYHAERRGPRVVRFNLDAQSQEAAMFQILEMQRQLGTTGELIFLWDTADDLYQPARTFLGRLRSIAPLTAISSNLWSAAFEVKESL